MENHRLYFKVKNDKNAGNICSSEFKEQLETWIATHTTFSRKRILQIWSATWEAIQNALIHGSKRGDTIEIEITIDSLPSNQAINVGVKQPQIWQKWELYLGENTKRQLNTSDILLGGTIIMLHLADNIKVLEFGRLIIMNFSSQVMPERQIHV